MDEGQINDIDMLSISYLTPLSTALAAFITNAL